VRIGAFLFSTKRNENISCLFLTGIIFGAVLIFALYTIGMPPPTEEQKILDDVIQEWTEHSDTMGLIPAQPACCAFWQARRRVKIKPLQKHFFPQPASVHLIFH